MSTNPFASPQTPPYVQPPATPAFKPIDRLQYLRMYNYIFENPNWLVTILLAALCGLIPIIGPIVILGYQFECVISLLMSGGTRYPDFDFNRFADYLMRGLWPFLVQLVASLVLVPLAFVLVPIFFLCMGLAAAGGEDAGPVLMVIFTALFVMMVIPLSLVPALFLLPMQLRAALAQDFAVAFNFGWVWDFVKKNWGEMFLGMLFLAFTGMLLAICGMLACYIGLFFVIPMIYLAQAHFSYEVYLLFLSRGGEPVAIKMAGQR